MTAGDWYRRAFGRFYLEVYAHRDDDAAREEAIFAASALALEPGSSVLEVACGAGRHARALSALGCRVAGIDLSPDLLAEARRRDARARLVRADARALPFRKAFDAATLFFTSFGYFGRTAEDESVLREIARVLRPGAGLLLDLPNREVLLAGLVPESEDRRGAFRVIQRRRMSVDGLRVEKSVTVRREDGGLAAEWTESVRLYAPEEIEAMLRRSGWMVEARYGDLAGAGFSGDSTRFVTVSRKAR